MTLPLYRGCLVAMAAVVSIPVTAIELDQQVIYGQLYQSPIAAQAYSVEVLTQSDLQLLPVTTIADALEWVAGLDVRQRGSGGTQVDLSIRGASYEQTLILIDGVRMNDPQTGHHNFDLPVVLEDLEQIEIVRGPGAGQYGPNGNGGVINLVTRKSVVSETGRQARLSLEAGSKDYDRAVVSLGKTEGRWSTFASVAQQTSDSYLSAYDLAYTSQQGNARLVYQGERSSTLMGAGYLDKDFGADGFYGPLTTPQSEKIIQRHIYLDQSVSLNADHRLDLLLNWRQHDDEFLYARQFLSEHQSEALQTRFRYHFNDQLTAGVENNDEQITSTSLLPEADGKQKRSYQAAFVHGYHTLMGLNLSGSLSYIDYSNRQSYTLPVIGASYTAGDIEIYANAGQSARIPTVFDLYLKQGSNRGNPDLKAEQTRSAEVGARINMAGIQTKLALFDRVTEDALDFTVTQAEFDAAQVDGSGNKQLVYTARNIEEISTRGYDLELDASNVLAEYGVAIAQLSYTHLDQDFKNAFARGKYAISQFEHQAVLKLGYELTPSLALTSSYKYEDRITAKSYQLWDLGLKKSYMRWHWSFAASNILNEKYIDSGFVPAPGIGYRFSVAVTL